MKFKKPTIRDNSGFTLTEVMIGMMILTIAIVAATNLLVGLLRSNDNNVKTLQAYYFAQEGIEAARNIRDTNWIYNFDWLGDVNPNAAFLRKFEKGAAYGISLVDPNNYWNISNDEVILRFAANGEETPFKRVVAFDEYDCGLDNCDDFVLVTSTVSWSAGSKEREVKLQTVLTDWKGGAL